LASLPAWSQRWRQGALVPDRMEWKKLCGMVARGLWSFQGLHGEALVEQDEDRQAQLRSLRRNGNGHTTGNGTAVVTNFGDKLVAAIAAPAPIRVVEPPQPTPEPDDPAPDHYSRPPGWRQHDKRQERYDRALEIVRSRPSISTRGPDGLIALIQKEFGVGLSDESIGAVREQVARERAAAIPPPTAPPPTPPGPPLVATAAVNDADVSAGVELIIGAIPGLQQMTIAIDDQGVASVSYSVRRVEITTISSSLTVRR
jgi:hypothetical protein